MTHKFPCPRWSTELQPLQDARKGQRQNQIKIEQDLAEIEERVEVKNKNGKSKADSSIVTRKKLLYLNVNTLELIYKG
ncbi:hypothetical protein GLYMA_08G144900v4 [Glycine max]|uniref:Uncharacterized protein n=1 Tax=Glycine max TaxID=3847 RepID=A0A0R0ISV6_SOYBN|nr:hypothetical protein JHK87_021284 [Glycine soja]KRH43365.1 hypothetical protein GLYMA_08G144900v4 [Glycine max]